MIRNFHTYLKFFCYFELVKKKFACVIEDSTVNFRAERSATQSLRQQQDQAYEESLRADQEKDRKREEERRAREEQEAKEKAELNAQEMEIQRVKIEKELTIRKVPLEPEPANPNACHLQIKLGERTVKRRFLMSNTIEVNFSFSMFLAMGMVLSFRISLKGLLNVLGYKTEFVQGIWRRKFSIVFPETFRFSENSRIILTACYFYNFEF